MVLLSCAMVAGASCSPAGQPVGDSAAVTPTDGLAAPANPKQDAVIAALASLPPDVRGSVESALANDFIRFQELLDEALTGAAAAGDFLQLVDKSHPLPADYIPPDLVDIDGYGLSVSRPGHRLRSAMMPELTAMDMAARADGVVLVVSSAFRSYEYQKNLFSRYAAAHGEAEASRFSARAGTSQHQLGTAMDLGSIDDSFARTDAGRWMAANAGRFGFSLSYPYGMEQVTGYVWESWHFRYIGRAAAALESEFFGGVQQYLLMFLDAYRKNAPADRGS